MPEIFKTNNAGTPENSRRNFDESETFNVPAERIPAHIAFIMDGNGRWAKSRGLHRFEGHLRGTRTVIEIVEEAFRLGVSTITLYAFSVENQKRPPEEISALMELLKNFIGEYLPVLLKNEIRLRVIGDLSWFPAEHVETIENALAQTSGFRARTLVVALNYSSRDELLRAVSAYAADVARGNVPAKTPDWATFSRYLDTAEIPDPDLIVRTSGEFRLSNFLLLQSAYSELYFCETPWPDFSARDLRKALADYAARERRFGKTGDQLARGA